LKLNGPCPLNHSPTLPNPIPLYKPWSKNIGTVTYEEGYFQLEVDPQKYGRSNLHFSMIGFESKTFLLEEYIENEFIIIPLEEEDTALDEVVITTKRKNFQAKLLGIKTTSKFIYASFHTNKLGNEMGFVVRQRKRPMILKKFNISLVVNDYGTDRFRLNFYSIQSGLPTTTLLKENIIIETDIT